MGNMFCYQCEQSFQGQGCSTVGVCGKDSLTAGMQDILVHLTLGIGQYASRARALGAKNRDIDVFVLKALFTSVTNVNFDSGKVSALIGKAVAVRATARALYEEACAKAGKTAETLTGPAVFALAEDTMGRWRQSQEIGLEARKKERGDTLTGLEELVLYGLKGAAAYADHALVLGKESDTVFGFFHEVLDFLTQPHAVEDYLTMALRVGQSNLEVMGLLDAANTGAFGHPTPTAVRITPKQGKAILVSGHDFSDLKVLLEQTKDSGIQIYTHGEMLPAHGYPELKKYPHLAGNYGGAWQDQAIEFDAFPGAILMTTNCIQTPLPSYINRLFTTGLVAFPGVKHVPNGDFAQVISAALAAPGFSEEEPAKTITVGFGHKAMLGVADKIVDAVKAGAIRHFFLIGGCDGARPGRNYYTRLAEQVPKDCVVLTLACGKYRFNKLDFGNIGGIPRLLDIGQCNDAYSAIQIAVALSKAFNTDVNHLPLSMVVSWYEQKAVAILLTLLHLGIRNIRLGPTLPSFLTKPAIDVLAKTFGIAPITTPEADLKTILG